MEHIIVVDDHRDNLLVLTTLLESFGYSVRSTTNPDKVVALIKESVTDTCAIFLDLEMRRDGFSVFDDIYQFDIPVIAYSAHCDQKDRALRYGFFDFLPKPIEEDELDKILARID